MDDLTVDHNGLVVSRFLASGVRHIAGADERLASFVEGQALCLRDDSGNLVNARAILIDARDGEPVGYVPDWLVEDVHRLRDQASEFRVFAERINPDAPAHLKLLCRIEVAVRHFDG